MGTAWCLLPPAEDQQIGQLGEAHRALAQACLPRQLDGILVKHGAQGSTHACSTHHRSAPVSEKRDYNLPFIFSQQSFFVCWVNPSSALSWTPMGSAERQPHARAPQCGLQSPVARDLDDVSGSSTSASHKSATSRQSAATGQCLVVPRLLGSARLSAVPSTCACFHRTSG